VLFIALCLIRALAARKYWEQSMIIRRLIELFRRPAKVEHMMEDEFFGKLAYDEKFHWWSGIMTLSNGKTASLKIDGLKSDESIPEEIRNTAKILIANEQSIHDKIAVSMSEVYNGTWGCGDTITPQELAQKITLTGVSFYDEGCGELYYGADDEIFTDHTICAPIDANGEVGEPDLAG
jgi:hypothetical protein